LLKQLPCERQQQALEIIRRLFGERVLLEGHADYSHRPSPLPWVVEGSGKLSERLRRGFVSSVFRPHAGPCLGCLIRHFQRLSPAPEIYEHLIEHSCAGGEIPPVPFPAPALDLLAALARWKIESSAQSEPSVGVYRLHVVETDTMDCTTHRVFRDPHCPDCSPR
jgi:hypothetical protein